MPFSPCCSPFARRNGRVTSNPDPDFLSLSFYFKNDRPTRVDHDPKCQASLLDLTTTWGATANQKIQ